MTEAFEPNLQPQEILNVLSQNIDIIDHDPPITDPTIRQQKLNLIYQSLKDLNIYFLISPERLSANLKVYLLRILKHPPSKEIMEICTQCIYTALTSKVSTVVQPSDLSFTELIEHVKKDIYTDQTKINLLEIIFTISDEQWSKIANSKPDDIDIFFKYYDSFDAPSKISCLKCINNIVSHQVFARFVIFLPKLLEIAKNSESGTSMYDYSIQAFITISNFLNKTTIMKQENFEPLKYCEDLCFFTSHYNDQNNLSVFIDSIRVCVLSFKTTIPIIFKYIKLSSYFESIEKVSVLEAVIKLALSLMPAPQGGLIELFPIDEFKWASHSISEKLIWYVKDIVPHVFRLYYENLALSKLCLKAMTYFVYSKSFQFSITNQVVYMMHFSLCDLNSVPYVLAIASECLKMGVNVEAILKTKLIERCIENLQGKSNFCDKLIKEIEPMLINGVANIEFNNFDQLIDLISKDKLSPFDLFASYVQISNKRINHFYNIKLILKKKVEMIDEKCQILVNYLVNMLSDLPIPITLSDPYFPDYKDLNDAEIEIQNDGNNYDPEKLSFCSILSEMNEREVTKAEIKNLIKNNSQLKFIIDKSTLKHNNKYVYNVLYRELANIRTKTAKINNVEINDPEQFVISILPQILSNSIDDQIKSFNPDSTNCLEKVLRKKFKYQTYEIKSNENQTYKRNSLIIKPRYLKGEEIVQEILDILNIIFEKDTKRFIQFHSENFAKGIIHQLNFFFLSICLYSPCSQMMVKYPFLFDMNERLYLFKLLNKEPLMAKEFHLKSMNQDYKGEKIEPFSKIMFNVHRDKIFHEGIIILEKFAKYKSFLEISFHDDVGYGKGTTSQFFDKMSQEFCKKRHRLWRRGDDDDNNNSIYVHNDQGLFPYATANSRYMHALGLFVAKAIQMEQVIDIPLNPAFFDLAAGRTIKLKDVDESLARGLYHETTEKVMIECERTFVEPIEGKVFNIIKNGSEILVTHENFDKFVRAREEYIIGKYVKKKIDKFVEGFAEVMDPIFLKMFSGEEMIMILNGSKEMLTVEDMNKFLVVDTGYDNDSVQIQYLKEIVSEFNYEYQKSFIKYVTGSSYLPYGGLKVLDPPIKVVRREVHDKKYKAEECWPASKTCIHLFLLPPYQSKELMRESIIKVISDPYYSDSFGLT